MHYTQLFAPKKFFSARSVGSKLLKENDHVSNTAQNYPQVIFSGAGIGYVVAHWTYSLDGGNPRLLSLGKSYFADCRKRARCPLYHLCYGVEWLHWDGESGCHRRAQS